MRNTGSGDYKNEKKTNTQWPSKGSFLETPERKRSRFSTSFADSGLGSSLFGSPPFKLVTIVMQIDTIVIHFFLKRLTAPLVDTSSVLRTPTGKKSCGSGSDSDESPFAQILHISAFSDSFGSPESKLSPYNLQLSEPDKALEFRITENSVPVCSGSVKKFSLPSTSRTSAYKFTGASPRSPRRELCDFENEDNVAGTNLSYSVIETPSKGFRNELPLETSSFDENVLLTSPAKGAQGDDPLHFRSLPSARYCIPEQTNGPIESSLCGAADLYNELYDPIAGHFVEEYNEPVMPSKPRKENRNVTGAAKLSSVSYMHHRTCLGESNQLRPFRPPSKGLQVNSKLWLQITCGETAHQVELTRSAHLFLGSRDTLMQ